MLLLAALLLGGCARVHASLAVQPGDTVDGEVVIATPTKGPDDKGPTVTIPPDLASAVTVTPYGQEGYTGSLLRFSGLTFVQTGELARALAPTAGSRFEIRRVGGRVLLQGAADLTTVKEADKADFGLKISFPGAVVDTNGEIDGDTVSWTFNPAQVGDIAATAAYADPNAPSVLTWTFGVGGVVAAIALGVAIAARRTRNPPVSR